MRSQASVFFFLLFPISSPSHLIPFRHRPISSHFVTVPSHPISSPSPPISFCHRPIPSHFVTVPSQPISSPSHVIPFHHRPIPFRVIAFNLISVYPITFPLISSLPNQFHKQQKYPTFLYPGIVNRSIEFDNRTKPNPLKKNCTIERSIFELLIFVKLVLKINNNWRLELLQYTRECMSFN